MSPIKLSSTLQSSFSSILLYHTMMKSINVYQDRELMRAAIALNNAAASLLHKGHTTKALRLFKTVVAFLQQSTKTRICPERLGHVLQQAAAQVASAKKKHDVWMEIQVLDDDDDAAKYEAAAYGPSSSLGFVFRLGDHLYDQGEDERYLLPLFQYLTTVVLHNFGLAYRCGFLLSGRMELLVGAQQTLRSARFLLLGCASNTEELFELYRWHVLHVLLRHSMVQVRSQLTKKNCANSFDEAMGQQEETEYFIVDPEEVQYIQDLYQQCKTAAAAA
mmetsp:Transcript_12436/g.23820  ORF Transcript_12436/g.23820 Transcript_12436/m.23820 type:complete len:276 (+) Transcript_12436:2-829(+)